MSFDVFELARRAPDALAVLDAERECTYAELAKRCAGTAARLAERDLLVPGRALAVIARPSLPTLVTLATCFAHDVPVLALSPRLPASDREELAKRAGARGTVEPDDEELSASTSPPARERPVDPSLPLAIIPTSGTTGKPKLVALSRAAFAASAAASGANLPLGPGDRWFLCLPPSHVGGLSIVTRSLFSGSAVCLFDAGDRGLLRRASELAVELERSRATLVSLVPALLDALLDLPGWRPPRPLRAALLGGAATSPALLDRALKRGVPVLVSYGLSEACSQVTTTPFGTAPRIVDGLVSSGRPLPGVELRVLADDRIRVKGPMLASSLIDGELALDAEGFLLTDDLGHIDETGELVVYGRASERIVSGGENVDPLRVEAVLLRDPNVRGACVFGIPDERFGELVACALLVSQDFDPSRCQAKLERELAPEARPRRIALLEALPALPNGKIDRAATRELARARLAPWSLLSATGEQTPT